MDSIHIRNLSLECIIGVDPRERAIKQDVIVSVTLHGEFRGAGQSDRLEETVDYAAIRERIVAAVEQSHYHLLEALAQSVADVCLADPRIAAVDVIIEKPGAFSGAGSVAVEIHREKDEKDP